MAGAKKSFINQVIASLLLIFCLLMAPLVWALSEEEIRKYVTEEYGPILNKDDSPVLYQTLDGVFSRLSAAQRELVGDGYLTINEMHVVDSPILNAFVVSDKPNGVRRVINRVYITTALINKMYAPTNLGLVAEVEPTARELKEGTTRIAGVLSHELAHPIEETDPEAFKNRLGGKMVASQAREIRADSEGAMISKKAGYPAESVYLGLKKLFENDSNTKSALTSLGATHPENNLRLSGQRSLLTLARYQQGASTPTYPEPVKRAFAQELRSINKAQESWQFLPPKNLSEALNRLIAVPTLRRSDKYREIEFNRLLLFADQQLAQKAEGVSSEEKELFLKFAKAFASQRGYPDVFEKDDFKNYFTKETGSASFASLPDHYELMKKNPIAHSPEYEAWIKKEFPFSETQQLHEIKTSRWVALVPLDRAFDWYRDQFVGQLKQNALIEGSASLYANRFEEGMPREFRLKMANLYYENVFPSLNPTERINMAGYSGSEGNDFMPQYNPKANVKGGEREGIMTQRHKLLSDPRKRELQNLNAKLAQRFWDQRGYWGVMELTIPFYNFDWQWVWESLKIDPEIGKNQLRAAVKNFTKTPEYTEMIRESMKVTNHDLFRNSVRGQRPTVKYGPPSWLDSSLWSYLAGKYNPQLKADPIAQDVARKTFAGAIFEGKTRARTDAYRKAYSFKFNEWLKARPPGQAFKADEIIKANQEVHAWISKSGLLDLNLKEFFERLKTLPLDEAVRRETLKLAFLQDQLDWLKSVDPQVRTAIISELKKSGVIRSSLELLDLKLKAIAPEIARGKMDSRYFDFLESLKEEVSSDLDLALKKAPSPESKSRLLLKFSETYLNPIHGQKIDNAGANSKEIRDLKARVVQRSESLSLTENEKVRLFKALTGTGPTLATDGFFNRELAKYLNDPLNSAHEAFLREQAERQRFMSTGTQLAVARKLLDGRVSSLEKRGASQGDLESLVTRINQYVPQASLKKDDYLESLAWRLNLQGSTLNGLIEDEKSYNWRKANPLLVNMGSGLAVPLNSMDVRARERFIEYLLNPEGKEMPEVLYKEVEASAYRELLAKNDPESARSQAKEAALTFKYKLEGMLMDSSPTERIPLYELILTSGDDALAKKADYPLNIARKYLNYTPGSVNEKMLLAFLKVIPEHERSVTLSYLLSQVGEDKSGVNSLFEVFQTVGIKFGQMSSVWKIFGEKIAKETASLKDNAKPMSKAEIEEVLKTSLSPEETKKIKSLKKVLGSASLKTVVLAELQDGKEVVGMVQRPFATNQIQSNLDLSLKFIEQLKKEKVEVPAGLFDALVKDLRSQLMDETKMTEEAKRIQEAKVHFEKMNGTLKDKLNGYRFEVPTLAPGFEIRDYLLFVEKAQGMSWHKLSPEVQRTVGGPIAESSLRLFFREGWFDPDRHAGNVMVDPDRKVIYPIDFGQAETFSKLAAWKEDDRYIFAQFLRALSEENVPGIVEYGLKMRESKGSSAKEREHLKAKITQVLKETHGKSLSDRMIGVVNGMAEADVKLQRKFSFGALKGLMLLQGENYVDSGTFSKLVKAEITQVLKEKLPLAGLNAVGVLRERCPSFFEVFRGAL